MMLILIPVVLLILSIVTLLLVSEHATKTESQFYAFVMACGILTCCASIAGLAYAIIFSLQPYAEYVIYLLLCLILIIPTLGCFGWLPMLVSKLRK